VLDLRNILESANNGLHDGAFVEEDFVHQWHECIFHVGANAGHQMDIESPQ